MEQEVSRLLAANSEQSWRAISEILAAQMRLHRRWIVLPSAWLEGFRSRLVAGRTLRRRAHGPKLVQVGVQEAQVLEDRKLLTATSLFIAGELQIQTDANESVRIQPNPSNASLVQVLVNNAPLVGQPTLQTSQVNSLVIVTGDAENTVDVSAVTAISFANLTHLSISTGNGDDSVIGSPDFGDIIDAGHGNDTIDGQGGDDSILSGDGDDSVIGGAGNDTIDADDGNDSVQGGIGNDSIVAGDGADLINGDDGDDSISGDDGNDTLAGDVGNDFIVGNSGADSVNGNDGNDTVFGGAGEDILAGDIGDDWLKGNGANDVLDGGDGNDSLDGDTGDDSLHGGNGNDSLNGQLGSDTLIGDAGNDVLQGGAGQDLADGSDGNDTLSGQGGDDTLIGGGGADVLNGGDGNDVLQSISSALSIDDVTITEGDTTNSVVTFTVTLSLSLSTPVTVNYATASGTATAGSDFVSTSGTLTFAPGVTSQTISVQVVGDVATESDETFVVNLTNANGASIQDAQGQATITDNDNASSFGVPIVNVAGQNIPGPLVLAPPDTDGEAGPNHYVQVINGTTGARVQVYNKTGAVLTSFTMASLGNGGAPANATTDGDGMVVYDQIANRWILMEFSASGTFGFYVHVSQTPDPTNGLWNNYFFQTTGFPDYPKISVWPDAYYITTNETNAAGTVLTPAVYALDRTNMLTGAAAAPMQRFVGPGLAGLNFQAYSPADMEGATAPGAGSNAYFMRQNDDELNSPGTANPTSDTLELWQLHTDFTTPANSAFSLLTTITVADFDADFNRPQGGFGSIPQPNGQLLDPIPEVLMSRTHYRNFGAYEVLLGSYVTDTNNTDHAGIRWFELRRSGGGAWSLFQEGLVNPDNVVSRWMPSIDMDGAGNIAIGYSVSGLTTFPSIRYIGRRATDPLGTMPQGEFTIIAGTGSQQGVDRWGDYASMTVDPADDATFWFTSEYAVNSGTWATQIAAFSFANSGTGGGGGGSGNGGSTPVVVDAGDTITGGNGNDTLTGATGDDLITGSAGADVIDGGSGSDTIFGGAGNDSILGGTGNDTLQGNGGKDTLNGGSNDDTLIWRGAPDGTDSVAASDGYDSVLVQGSAAGDTLTVASTGSSLTVSQGAATLTVDPSIMSVTVSGGAGNDTITVADVSSIGLSALTINGDAGDDFINATNANNTGVVLFLNGGTGNDGIRGGSGTDFIDGGDGNDNIQGRGGDDDINGGLDDDIIDAGDGNDHFDGGDGSDTINGGNGNDVGTGGLGNDSITGDAGNDSISGGLGDDSLNGSSGDDSVLGDLGSDILQGGAGNDTVDGGRNNDTISGNSGDDVLRGDHGDDVLNGGVGNDTINAGDGNDTVYGGDGDDLISGGDGNDYILGQLGRDTIVGGDGNDTLNGGGSNDTILGQQGDDVLKGSGGTDLGSAGQGSNNNLTTPAASIEIIDETFALSSALLNALAK